MPKQSSLAKIPRGKDDDAEDSNFYPSHLDASTSDFAAFVLSACDKQKIAEVLRKGPIRVGSFCTGAATESWVFSRLQTEWTKVYAKEFRASWEVVHVFAVESHKEKRRFQCTDT